MSESDDNPYRPPRSRDEKGSGRADNGRFYTGTVLFFGGFVTAALFSNSFDVDTDPPWKLTELLGCLIFIAAVLTSLSGALLITVRLVGKE